MKTLEETLPLAVYEKKTLLQGNIGLRTPIQLLEDSKNFLWVLPVCARPVPNLVLGLPLQMIIHKISLLDRPHVSSSESCSHLLNPILHWDP